MAHGAGEQQHNSAGRTPPGGAGTSRAPLVSILIPVHNRLDLTQPCLESIFAHADPEVPAELLIIDDCSTDDTPRYLQSLGGRVRVLRNEQRKCFGHNMNEAAQQARGKYLCLLNNDTYVTAGWLRRLVEVAERDPRIGVVGNKHLFPNSGKVNHAGMVFDDRGCPTHLYPGQDADYPPANVSREFQILTAACWLVPRDLFLDMGGFDPKFRNGYEDVDFCLRVRQRQGKVYYCAESVIYHYGQSSPNRTDNDAANGAYFQSKWQGAIRPDLQDYVTRDQELLRPKPAARAAEKARHGKPSPADVHFAIPLDGGNSFTWVTSQLVLALDDIGMKVSLKPGPVDPSVGRKARARLQGMMERKPSPRAQIKWTHYWQPYLAEVTTGAVNAEIFVTNYRYGGRPLHEIDHWMRHAVVNGRRKLPLSRFCQDALTELGVPEERCAILPCGYSPEIGQVEDADRRFRKYGCVLLAITNSHDPYRYGTDTLLEAYGRAFQAGDDVVLVLKDYGKGADLSLIAKWLEKLKNGPRVVHLAEFVDKADLIKLYRGADAFVAPFRGEGFGMKILDACAVGLPVLSPLFGGPADYLLPGTFFPLQYQTVPVGECYDRKNGILPACAAWAEVDVDDLARQLRAVAQDRKEARRRALKAQDHVLENYSWKRAAERLRDAITRFETDRRQVIASRQPRGPERKQISVIIPTYDRADALEQCLSAYEAQTLPASEWEMIVVDDGSHYDARALVAKHADRLPVQFIHQANAGPGRARNHGVELSRGEVVFFTGDDIIPEPAMLAEHVKAHRAHPDVKTSVLGYTYWHPDVEVTPLMQYMTGEGGQQFAYDHMTPNNYAPFACFYTSNVSIKRSFLVEQEEMFSTRFPCAAFEDVELAVRLAQHGMKLWYHPAARGGHLHPMTDRQAFDRQYKVGRMLVVYALHHPELVPEEHAVFFRWLDLMQHLLLPGSEYLRQGQDLPRLSESLQTWMDSLSATLHGLTAQLKPEELSNWPARNVLRDESRRWAILEKKLWAYHFDLAMRSGMADEWMGVRPGDSNPVRDFIRLYLATGVWSLLDRGTPHSPVPAQYSRAAHRVLKLARHLRHHPWLSPLWNRMTRLPGYKTLNTATKKMLNMIP